jgi:ribosomal protein L24
MKAGTKVKVTSGILKGVKGEVVKQSKRSATLSIKLLETMRCYTAGSVVHLMPYEVEETKES